MIDKIRKLLQTAESLAATNPEAAETYSAKAFELMAAHGIEEALLDETRSDSEKQEIAKWEVDVDAPHILRKVELLFAIAATSNCYGLVFKTKVKGRYRGRLMKVTGTRTDLERVKLLYHSLCLQLASALDGLETPEWEDRPRSYRHSWVGGYVGRVAGRLYDVQRASQREAQVSTSTSVELVLVSRKERAKDLMHKTEKVGKGKFKPPASRSNDGFSAGWQEGGNATLHHREVTGQ